MDDAQVVYEHLHRYVLARELAHGRQVIDVGCGEGYGAALLAGLGSDVLGVDIDPEIIEHARQAYVADNLRFEVGSADGLEGVDDATFDLVVCFEVLEHMAEHDRLVGTLRRVLRDDGVLILSTPDREPYNATRAPNPFHVREVSRDELLALLEPRFAHVALYDQALTIGSRLRALGPVEGWSQPHVVEAEHTGDMTWVTREDVSTEYLIAVASNAPLPALPPLSVLHDPSRQLLVRSARAHAETVAEPLERELEELRRDVGRLEADTKALSEDVVDRKREVSDVRTALARTEAELTLITGSRAWRLVERLRRVRSRLSR